MKEKLPRLATHLENLEIDISTVTLNWHLAIFFDAVPFEVRCFVINWLLLYYGKLAESQGLLLFNLSGTGCRKFENVRGQGSERRKDGSSRNFLGESEWGQHTKKIGFEKSMHGTLSATVRGQIANWCYIYFSYMSHH